MQDVWTIQELAAQITAHRLKLQLSWPEYAKLMGVPQETLYKIAKLRTTRPHETTVHKITQKIKG